MKIFCLIISYVGIITMFASLLLVKSIGFYSLLVGLAGWLMLVVCILFMIKEHNRYCSENGTYRKIARTAVFRIEDYRH